MEVRFSVPPRGKRHLILPLLAFALLAEPAAAAQPQLRVMTRNVYLGGNIAGPIPAPDRPEFERRASALCRRSRPTTGCGRPASCCAGAGRYAVRSG